MTNDEILDAVQEAKHIMDRMSEALKRQVQHTQQINATRVAYLALCLELGRKGHINLDVLAGTLSETGALIPEMKPHGEDLLNDLSARVLQISTDLQSQSKKH